MDPIMRKKSLQPGDVFYFNGEGGTLYFGLIVCDLSDEIGAVLCCFYLNKWPALPGVDDWLQSSGDPVASSLVTPELLQAGQWKVLFGDVPLPTATETYVDDLRKARFVGCRIVGSGLIPEYMDTRTGLKPRSEWPDIEIVDRFFRSSLDSKGR
jgi:hypothetical protein